ncbi:WbqC family protein [Pseudidiomarina sp. 1APP75-32.1]|uniref:WbqC family protein n=1 Tax=Pseudidiomarina terrestris TaxID=2820060 RepID=A0AAW7QYI6_9GAMM|nr:MULTISPECIES: WbqC family protein [unclassified Pseudidiomarina]MDN7124506.1 WbqC family protein [Pseudidiomarina sp. 1APP75-32.1]MDN7129203.1 WbqC family protein [Pseudidiomarina sp. 1APR75-15]
MKLAVMQPYLFPYIGYFQLMYAADLFLIYDDVNYIKRGFVNRNNVLSANGVTRFTVPVPGASQNKLFCELEFSDDVDKALKTISHCYAKAPYFDDVFPLVQETLEFGIDSGDRSIAAVCQKGFESIFAYLGIEKEFKKTSELDYDREAGPRDRLIALSHKFDADCYINAPGGRKLYDARDFAEQGLELKFIESLPVEYPQSEAEFTPNLSIIDVLMNCSADEVKRLLQRYQLA